MKLLHKGIVLVLVPVAFECVFVGSLFYMLRQSELEFNLAEHARQVSMHLNRIERLLMAITGGLPVLQNGAEIHGPERYRIFKSRIDEEFLRLKMSVKDDPELIACAGKIEESLNETMFMMEGVKNVWTLMDKVKSSSQFRKTKGLLDDVTDQMDLMMVQMQKIEGESPRRQAENRAVIKELLMLGLLVNILMAVVLAFQFNKDTVSRLSIVMENARNFAEGKALGLRLTGNDEIAALDRAFSVMAANLNDLSKREKALLSNAADVICSLDDGGIITEVSPACEKVWGYEASEILSMRLLNLVVPEDAEMTMQYIESSKATNTESSFENRITRKDASVVDMLWSLKWSPEEHTFFCVAHDNTERKAAEHMKQDFVSMLSHDLRSPLSSVQAFFALVDRHVYGSLNEKGMTKVKSLETTISWLIELIGDLLDINRIEAGLSDLDLKVVSLKNIVVKADEALDALAGQEEILTHLPAQDADVRVDRSMFSRVVTNLLSNAIEFAPRHSEVRIEIEKLGDWVELRVIDQGKGIAPEQQEAIFEKFRQVRQMRQVRDKDATQPFPSTADHLVGEEANLPTLTDQPSGEKKRRSSGLGLAVSKAIVQQHRGTIGVRSVPGEGSTFWVRLPSVERAAGG